MRTTVNLEPDAYRLARALAARGKTSIGKILSDALMNQFKSQNEPSSMVSTDSKGFPSLYLGRTITPEDVAAVLEEE